MHKVNYHTHTYRCGHASGTELDYLNSALENKLSVLGFSDHAPYPDDRLNLTKDTRMNFSELQDYIDTIRYLQINYQDKIKILIGLEIEYDELMSSYYNYLLNYLSIDYLILGQHVFLSNDTLLHTFSLSSTESYIDYAVSISKALETDFFKFLAHPDLIFINDLPWDENCEKACDIIIESALRHDTILELNANGFRRGIMTYPDGNRYPYPHNKFWEKVAKTNLKVIINSDCHKPEVMWDAYMDQAYEYAKNLGLNIIYEI